MRYMFSFLTIFLCAIAAAQHGHGGKGSGVVSLDACSQGSTVHLLIARQTGEQPAGLFYLRSGDDGRNFTSPVWVGDNQPAPTVKRGADARIVAWGDNLLAVWTTRDTNDRFERGPLATAISSDGGRTWTPGPNPSDNPSSTGHAFIALTVDSQGVFHLVWLDARKDAGAAEAKPGKGLRYTQSSDFGKSWSKNITLDPETCECCWNSIVASNGSIHVLYRDRDPRDMAMVTSSDGGKTWGSPTTVGKFGWAIEACPHTGGAIARSGNSLVGTVWTGHGESAGAYLIRSDDAGTSWSSPQRLGDESSWHTDTTSDSRGQLAVVWDASVGEETFVFAMVSNDAGKTWSSASRLSNPGVNATHPRVIATMRGFRAFWTESSGAGESAWRSAIVK